MKNKNIVKQSYIVKIGKGFFQGAGFGDATFDFWLSHPEMTDGLPNSCTVTVKIDDAYLFDEEVKACDVADYYGGKVMKKTLSLEDV